MNIAYLIGLVIIIGCLSNWLGRHLSQLAPYFIFRLILFPGIILHESAHVIGCIITGAHIHRINFWTQSGGEVVHTKPKLPIIGQPIISFAPFVAGMTALILLSGYVMDEPITVTWERGGAILLMTSIGATLIPSRQDLANSWFSALLTLILLLTLFFYWPSSWVIANTLTEPLLQPFILTTLLIASLVLLTKIITLRR